MKSVNKKAQAIFQAAVDQIPEGDTSATIDTKRGYMALHVERIGDCRYGPLFSFAHYYEQNGDMMRDPDVVMIRHVGGGFFPISYRQDGLGMDREYVRFEGDKVFIHRKQQADLAVFCGTWAQNLKEQQGL
jgi:hypothetical protein